MAKGNLPPFGANKGEVSPSKMTPPSKKTTMTDTGMAPGMKKMAASSKKGAPATKKKSPLVPMAGKTSICPLCKKSGKTSCSH